MSHPHASVSLMRLTGIPTGHVTTCRTVLASHWHKGSLPLFSLDPLCARYVVPTVICSMLTFGSPLCQRADVRAQGLSSPYRRTEVMQQPRAPETLGQRADVCAQVQVYSE